jgi:CRP-like cAMP-binding protein
MAGVETEAGRRFLGSPLLGGVSDDARRAVLSALEERRAAPGSVLLRQGEANDHLSFLIGGSVAVERARLDGKADTIAGLNAPSMFGTTTFFCPKIPSFSVRAVTEVWLLTLAHPEHDRLRRAHPHAAEALALSALRILAERFDELDRLFTGYIESHPDGHPKVTEWAGFRARLFEEPAS